jgi:hypothetical protein
VAKKKDAKKTEDRTKCPKCGRRMLLIGLFVVCERDCDQLVQADSELMSLLLADGRDCKPSILGPLASPVSKPPKFLTEMPPIERDFLASK